MTFLKAGQISPPRLHPLRQNRGMTLVETIVAAGVAVAALAGLGASTNQALRIARVAKSTTAAGQLISERLEAFRSANKWTSLTTPAGITSVVSTPASAASSVPDVTEVFTVESYPSGNRVIVTREANGTITNNGADISSSRCVKVTVNASWTPIGTSKRTAQFSTIITKGGI